jgi:hypothetical protein
MRRGVEERVLEEEGEVVNVGWVSLSRSGKSLNIRVMNRMSFVPLRDLWKSSMREGTGRR